MASKNTPESIITDANKIIELMTANPDVKMKDVTSATMKTDATAASTLLQQIASLELQLTPLRNSRDELMEKLSENCTRARAGFKSYFGLNSSQYEQAGGTRKSERKKPARKAAASAASTKTAGSN
jgi:hypothetical protein